MHLCTVDSFNNAIRNLPYDLPELSLDKKDLDHMDLESYFNNYLTKDVLNDITFAKFLEGCSKDRRKSSISRWNENRLEELAPI